MKNYKNFQHKSSPKSHIVFSICDYESRRVCDRIAKW